MSYGKSGTRSVQGYPGSSDCRPSSNQNDDHGSQSGPPDPVGQASPVSGWQGSLGALPDCSAGENHAPVDGPSGKSEQ